MIENLDEKFTNTFDCIVGFFDVLGITKSWSKDSKETLEKLYLINNFLNREKEKNPNLIIRTFSDNYFIALKVEDDYDYSFKVIADVIGRLYYACITRYKCLIRGSIARGNMHIDDTSILGDALIMAHYLESKVAVYPRIIVADSALSATSCSYSNRSLKNFIFQDFDMKLCLNILMFRDANEEVNEQLLNWMCVHLFKIKKESEEEKDERIKSKVLWTINYVNSFFLDNYDFLLINLDNREKRANEEGKMTES